jgi:DNA-binding NarL/FixJ family response regulator
MIRVLIIDDHPLIRAGLCHEIAQHSDFSVPVEAVNGEDALRLLGQQGWDAIVLEISAPEQTGLGLLPEIRRTHPPVPVLVLSSLPPAQFAVRALRSGASAFVSKLDQPVESVRAIRRIIAGKTYLSPKVAESMINSVNWRGNYISVDLLSEREFEVMRMLASGRTVSEIAKELALSVKTVSTYRARALEKMNMRTNAEFMQYAVRLGLID